MALVLAHSTRASTSLCSHQSPSSSSRSPCVPLSPRNLRKLTSPSHRWPSSASSAHWVKSLASLLARQSSKTSWRRSCRGSSHRSLADAEMRRLQLSRSSRVCESSGPLLKPSCTDRYDRAAPNRSARPSKPPSPTRLAQSGGSASASRAPDSSSRSS